MTISILVRTNIPTYPSALDKNYLSQLALGERELVPISLRGVWDPAQKTRITAEGETATKNGGRPKERRTRKTVKADGESGCGFTVEAGAA